MPVFRDIDYDTRINGSLEVNSTSLFKDNVIISPDKTLTVDGVDVISALSSRLDLSNDGLQTIIGSVKIDGSLTVIGGITGIDLTAYYTKSELQSSGTSSVHWNNITNVPTAIGEWSYQINDEVPVKVSGGQVLTFKAGEGIAISSSTSREIEINAQSYTAGDGLSLVDGVFSNSDKGSTQAIFKQIKVGESIAIAESNNDLFEIVGSGSTLVDLDTLNKKITISSEGVSYSAGTNISIDANNNISVVSSPTFSGLTIDGNIVMNHGEARKLIDGVDLSTFKNAYDSHIGTTNAHNVTAEGIGAVKANGDTVSGQLVFSGYNAASAIKIDQSQEIDTVAIPRLRIVNSTGAVLFEVNSLGEIIGKKLSVDTLESREQSETAGDFQVNGALTVTGTTALGDSLDDTTIIKGALYIGNDSIANAKISMSAETGNIVSSGSITATNFVGKVNGYTIAHDSHSADLSGHSWADQEVTTLSSPTFNELTISNNIIVAGNVDGVKVSTLKTDFDSHVGDVSMHHPPESGDSTTHHHDSKYYTRAEIDAMVSGKSMGTVLTIPAGSTEVEWIHNYNSENYAVACLPDSYARHVALTSKSNTSCTISIDDPCENDIAINLVLVGWGA